jgi:hypothetical protein
MTVIHPASSGGSEAGHVSNADCEYLRLYFAYTRSMPPQDQTHRVYLSFQFRDDWHCQFLEEDLKTALPRKLHFASSEKLIELVERGGGFADQDTRLAVSQGIEMGRGGIFLKLTEEQYAKLRKR